MAAEAFEDPGVLRFDVAEEVAVTGLRQDAEESFSGRVPAVFDLGDGQKSVAELENARRFVGLVAGVADDPDGLHELNHCSNEISVRASRPFRRSTRLPGKRSPPKSASR